MELSEGNLTIREYVTQFERLSRFTCHLVDSPLKKVNLHLRYMTLGHLGQSFEALVRLVVGLEKDGCQEPKQATPRPPLRGHQGKNAF